MRNATVQTFLVDCFPLHCPYERAYFRQEFASYRSVLYTNEDSEEWKMRDSSVFKLI